MSRASKYDETYIAEVVDVNDPEKRCRVKINVYDMFDGVPKEQLPWANFMLPLGSRPGEGTLTPVHVGDKVWVRFTGGDSRRPVVVGAAQAAPKGKVNLAPDQWGGEGAYEHKRTESQPEVEKPDYYADDVSKQNNVMIQRCKNGTVRVTQLDSGSAVEITRDGDIVVHCEGKLYLSVKGDALEEYGGNVERRIGGDLKEVCQGSISSVANGTYTIRGTTVHIN